MQIVDTHIYREYADSPLRDRAMHTSQSAQRQDKPHKPEPEYLSKIERLSDCESRIHHVKNIKC